MAAKLILSQPNPIANPGSPEFKTACENLTLPALGVLAWLHYASTYFPDELYTMDELDPNLESGVEEGVRELVKAGYLAVEGGEL
jgi:hypothetical protein